MRHATRGWTVALVICTTMAAAAQDPMAGHQMGSKRAIPPPSTLPVPEKMTGIGNSHIKITAKPEAQMWFDQGLSLQHDFWDYEAAKAFQQSVRVDPNCAMCQWGLAGALNNGHGVKGSYATIALDKAVELSHHASKKEQLIIEATKADESDGPSNGRKKKSADATALWQKAVDKDKKDPQTRIFLAESLMDGFDDKGEPHEGTKKGIALLEEIMKEYPDDSAANHYWIHAMEPSSHPERAIESAKKLASLAPASGHMVHMPGHIFYRTGNYAEAEHWFAASTAVDEAYMRDKHVAVDDDWNYVHNLMYGIDNLMAEGKMIEATKLSSKLAGARGELPGTLYTFAPRDGMTRVNTLLPVALRTGNWAQVQTLLADSKPNAKLENLLFLSGELREFARGMEAVEKNDVATAKAASNALDASLWRKTQAAEMKKDDTKDSANKDKVKADDASMVEVMPDAMSGPLVSVLTIMSLELRASIDAAEKKLPRAKELFAEAAKKEKALGYREPPMYIRPVGETAGAALLRTGDADGAHEAYASVLAERSNLGFALYGMARSSEAAKKPDVARTEYAKFLEAWKNADSNDVQVAHAKKFMGGEATAQAK